MDTLFEYYRSRPAFQLLKYVLEKLLRALKTRPVQTKIELPSRSMEQLVFDFGLTGILSVITQLLGQYLVSN